MVKIPSFKGGRRGKAITPAREDLKAQNLFKADVNDIINEELHELFDGTYSVERPGPWKRAFRPSGFPYCPVIDAMTGKEVMNYGKAFYLDIGTTVHELMQEYICRSPRGRRVVYANWKCKDCDHMHHFSPLPYVCINCGADSERLHYEELEFAYAINIDGGHIDLLVRTSLGWLVCDWKTASTTGLDYRTEADGKHHHQLQAYCLAVEEVFKDQLQGLPVIGYCLMFVPRDSSGNRKTNGSNWTPYVYLWDEKLAAATRKRLFFTRASYEAATVGYDTNNWLMAAKLRPCQSLEDFAKPMGMRDGFFGGKVCPNMDVCCRTDEDVAEAITKQREEMAKAEKLQTETEALNKKTYLECASQGFVAPELLAAIQASSDSEDYDHEKHESLLALKESLERHIALTHDRTSKAVTDFFNGEKPAKKPGKQGVRAKSKKVSA